MTSVNIQSGKIVGAKPNTLVYFHEQGHIEFANSNIGHNLHYLQSVTFIVLLTSLSLSFYFKNFKGLNISLIIAYLLIDTYEEIWAWIYAKQELKRYKSKRLRRKI